MNVRAELPTVMPTHIVQIQSGPTRAPVHLASKETDFTAMVRFIILAHFFKRENIYVVVIHWSFPFISQLL